jgi:glycosyltransferase involved in cell wall biosynthesis
MDKNIDQAPKVSVVMSVYNAEKFLAKAIQSILDQTFSDFEFIIINDGSKDKSLSIIKGFKDPRIKLVDRANEGIVYSANEGVRLARGLYIARMDSDDISLPKRFEKEVALMDADPKLGLVGSNYMIIDDTGKVLDQTDVFTNPQDLKVAMITCNQYGNSSTMMRKEAIVKAGMYKEGRVEDYDLFTRISRDYKIANIKEPLCQWRRNSGGYTYADRQAQTNACIAVRDREFNFFLKHRSQFHPLAFHPDEDVRSYRRKKSLILSNLAYLYLRDGHRFRAIFLQSIAAFLTPRWERNKRHLGYTLKGKSGVVGWEYDGI